MANSTKNMLAILLIITMIVSMIGTMAAISSLLPKQPVPVVEDLSTSTGKVSVYLEPAPIVTTGKVTVFVDDGG